jgi:hypothetical protein
MGNITSSCGLNNVSPIDTVNPLLAIDNANLFVYNMKITNKVYDPLQSKYSIHLEVITSDKDTFEDNLAHTLKYLVDKYKPIKKLRFSVKDANTKFSISGNVQYKYITI